MRHRVTKGLSNLRGIRWIIQQTALGQMRLPHLENVRLALYLIPNKFQMYLLNVQ